MRDISEIIKAIEAVVPVSEEVLHIKLKALETSCAYAAPELAYMNWTRLQDILISFIPVDNQEWHFKVAHIFRGD